LTAWLVDEERVGLETHDVILKNMKSSQTIDVSGHLFLMHQALLAKRGWQLWE